MKAFETDAKKYPEIALPFKNIAQSKHFRHKIKFFCVVCRVFKCKVNPVKFIISGFSIFCKNIKSLNL